MEKFTTLKYAQHALLTLFEHKKYLCPSTYIGCATNEYWAILIYKDMNDHYTAHYIRISKKTDDSKLL